MTVVVTIECSRSICPELEKTSSSIWRALNDKFGNARCIFLSRDDDSDDVVTIQISAGNADGEDTDHSEEDRTYVLSTIREILVKHRSKQQPAYQ